MAAVYRQQQPTPEPSSTLSMLTSKPEAMKAAIELEIFTAIAEGCTTAPAIASRCRRARRAHPVRFPDHSWLLGQGWSALRSYAKLALFLNRLSPAYVGTAIEFLLTPRLHLGGALCPAGAVCVFQAFLAISRPGHG